MKTKWENDKTKGSKRLIESETRKMKVIFKENVKQQCDICTRIKTSNFMKITTSLAVAYLCDECRKEIIWYTLYNFFPVQNNIKACWFCDSETSECKDYCECPACNARKENII